MRTFAARYVTVLAGLALVYGLVELGLFRGWWIALVVACAGTGVALGLAETYEPAAPTGEQPMSRSRRKKLGLL